MVPAMAGVVQPGGPHVRGRQPVAPFLVVPPWIDRTAGRLGEDPAAAVPSVTGGILLFPLCCPLSAEPFDQRGRNTHDPS